MYRTAFLNFSIRGIYSLDLRIFVFIYCPFSLMASPTNLQTKLMDFYEIRRNSEK